MQFTILALDGTDPEAPTRRQAARTDHIKMGDELLKSGNLMYGSALLHEDGSMKGSVYIVDFPSEEAMEAYMAKEPYVTGDVWRDIQIHDSSTRDPWQFNRSKEWFESRES